MDIPRIFTIAESAHRIHNPFTAEKLATLGADLRLEPGAGRATTASPAPAATREIGDSPKL